MFGERLRSTGFELRGTPGYPDGPLSKADPARFTRAESDTPPPAAAADRLKWRPSKIPRPGPHPQRRPEFRHCCEHKPSERDLRRPEARVHRFAGLPVGRRSGPKAGASPGPSSPDRRNLPAAPTLASHGRPLLTRTKRQRFPEACRQSEDLSLGPDRARTDFPPDPGRSRGRRARLGTTRSLSSRWSRVSQGWRRGMRGPA